MQPDRKHALRLALIGTILVLALDGKMIAGVIRNYFARSSRCEGYSHISTTLRTVRGQIELYRTQHAGNPPSNAGMWDQLLYASDTAGTTNATANSTYPLGPYLGAAPFNPANNQSAIGTTPSPTLGWIYKVSGNDYTFQAVNTTGNTVLTY